MAARERDSTRRDGQRGVDAGKSTERGDRREIAKQLRQDATSPVRRRDAARDTKAEEEQAREPSEGAERKKERTSRGNEKAEADTSRVLGLNQTGQNETTQDTHEARDRTTTKSPGRQDT